MSVYRYKLAPDSDQIKMGIDPSLWAGLSVAATSPVVTVDVTIGSTGREDLDLIMQQLGWAFDSIIVPP